MGGFGGLLLCVLAGFCAVRAIWSAPRHWSAHDPLRLALSPAIGLGLLSLVYFAVRVVLGQGNGLAVGGFAVLTLALAAGAWWRAGQAAPEAWKRNSAPIWLWIAFAVVAGIALATVLMIVVASPHGERDAWSIWDMRARFLFRAVETGAPFNPLMERSHLDYPLLVPSAVAGWWAWNGGEAQWLAAAVAILFLGSAVTVSVLVLARLRSTTLGLTAGMVLAGTPLLTRNAGALYADVPVGYFFLAAVALGLLALQAEDRRPLAFLAGLHAGMAAWTKNEGLMFCGVLLLSFLVVIRSRSELGQRVRLLLPMVAGMLVVLVFVGHFKFHYAPANDLIAAGKSTSMGAHLVDLPRYTMVFLSIVEGLLMFGDWFVPPVFVMGVWLGLQGLRRVESGAMLWPFVAASLQLLGYLIVYVVASDRLEWQLQTSVERLLLQIWPLAVFSLMLLARDSPATEKR